MVAKCKIQILLTISICLLMLSSCNRSMPTMFWEYEDEMDNEESFADTTFMMFVNEQSFFSQVATTRGTGAFDASFSYNKNKLANADIRVFAFRDSRKITDMPEAVDFTRSAFSGRNGDATNDHCLLDGEDYNVGMSTRLSTNSNGMLVPQYDGEIGFSKAKSYVGYNFFGYYLDDMSVGSSNTHRANDKIWYDIDVDGSSDILCGAAPRLTSSVISSKVSAGKLSIKSDERKVIESYRGYSAYAAKRGIYPVIDLQHVFARLVFTAYPYDENANNIVITGISVKTPYRGTLTVASRNLDEIGFQLDEQYINDSTDLYLCAPSKDGLKSVQRMGNVKVAYDASQSELPWKEREGKRLGESLLLPPAESYLVTIHAIENNVEVSRTSVITPGKKQPFKAGSIYNIKIAVGKKDVQADTDKLD